MASKDEIFEVIAAIAIGVLGGVAIAELLNYLFGYRCPSCGERISHGTAQCPRCRTQLRWEK